MPKEVKGVGSWADEVERAEAEKRETQAAAAVASSASVSAAIAAPSSVVQSSAELRLVATTKQEKIRQRQFGGAPVGGNGGVGGNRGGFGEPSTPSEMMRLPARPSVWNEDERDCGTLGEGPASYGGGTGRAERSRRSSYGVVRVEERRGVRMGSAPGDLSLRPPWADDSRASGKKSTAAPGGGIGAGSSIAGGGLESASRTDERYNWRAGKKDVSTVPLSMAPALGSWFRDSGPETDRWIRGAAGAGGSGNRPGNQERPRLVLDPPKDGDNVVKEAPKSSESHPFGGVGGSGDTPGNQERPRLVLDQPTAGDNVVKEARKSSKSNPFGHARPREEVLAEKGLDWKKIDSQFEAKKATSWAMRSQSRVDRLETEEEMKLKEEIDHLKKELDGKSAQGSAEDTPSLSDVISQKERDLEQLTRQLDDKLFGKRSMGRARSQDRW